MKKVSENYKKGKDIKCPFDCLFHYYTRSFQATGITINGHNHRITFKPSEFDTW